MIYLASKSPRRRQLLQQIGVPFDVLDVDVPERRNPGESPEAYVSRVARDKAVAGLRALQADDGAWVLGADTEVVLDQEVFGKPVDAAQAATMLRRLSGRTHQVISSIWLLNGQREESESSVSEVRFALLREAEIRDYVGTEEPFGKAGGYAIQGRAATFVQHLSGSYSGVMGLPLFEATRLLRRFGAFAE